MDPRILGPRFARHALHHLHSSWQTMGEPSVTGPPICTSADAVRHGARGRRPSIASAHLSPHIHGNGWRVTMAEAKKAYAMGVNHVALEVGDIE